MDATRFLDGKHVTLKHINKSVHPHEVDIGHYFSSGKLTSHSANHCVPIYEVIPLQEFKTTPPTLLFWSCLSFVTMLTRTLIPWRGGRLFFVNCIVLPRAYKYVLNASSKGLLFMYQHHVVHRCKSSSHSIAEIVWTDTSRSIQASSILTSFIS